MDEAFIAHLRTKGIVKIGLNSLGVITNLTREGSCSLGYNDIELMWETWQAAQAMPEGKYILQTFSTYSGVCEQRFNHKDIGVFESIDAAMFHARKIGLIMNHYGYEFRVIDAQEQAND